VPAHRDVVFFCVGLFYTAVSGSAMRLRNGQAHGGMWRDVGSDDLDGLMMVIGFGISK
jgi:hypothetical protein